MKTVTREEKTKQHYWHWVEKVVDAEDEEGEKEDLGLWEKEIYCSVDNA